MRQFEGELLTHLIKDKFIRLKEQKRLKSYLKGDIFFTYKGKTFFVNPSNNPNIIPDFNSHDDTSVPEIQI